MKYSFINNVWYGKLRLLTWLLIPLSYCYRAIVWVRKNFLKYFRQLNYPIPVIVVGNISVGGVGKTPLVIELVKQLQLKGLKVGIVSRGYGSTINTYPHEVQLQDKAAEVGDEPLLLAQRTQCPVVIAPRRTTAIEYLIKKYSCQIIVSDDGLQHYRMGRSIEIVVIDGTRGLGNGLCLPAGPLRESSKRLKSVDFVVVNEGNRSDAYSMTLMPGTITQLATGNELDIPKDTLDWFAVAAIGNPQRFYSTLEQLGLTFRYRSYPDHYQFKPKDFEFINSLVIMTEKDAVKCREFSLDTMYYLSVNAVLEDAFWHALWSHEQLKGYC